VSEGANDDNGGLDPCAYADDQLRRAEAVFRALEGLSFSERNVVRSVVLEKRSLEETAAALQMPLMSIVSLLTLGRWRLGKVLREAHAPGSLE
jgi:DNA-directed RNA polymerase specialized sigma24 family protein